MSVEIRSVEIRRRVCLESKHMDSNYREHLLAKLRSTVKGECSLKYGHLIEVEDIVRIENNHVSPGTSENVFTLVFRARTIRPEEGQIFRGKVCMTFTDGVLVSVMDYFKVLIRADSLAGFVYEGEAFVDKEGGGVVEQGDEVEFVLTRSKYRSDNQTYSCFGKLLRVVI